MVLLITLVDRSAILEDVVSPPSRSAVGNRTILSPRLLSPPFSHGISEASGEVWR